MKNFKKLIYLVFAIGLFSCDEPAIDATPAIKTNPKVTQVNTPKITTPANPMEQNPPVTAVKPPEIEVTFPTPDKKPLTGNIQTKPVEMDAESAEIAAKLKAMGNVNVGSVKILKDPNKPEVPQYSDAQKEQLYNSAIQKQMETVLLIVAKQYRIGNLTKRLTKTPSGIEYMTVQKGKGRQAIDGSFVAFKSMGATLDGNVFEKNLEKDRAYRVKIGKNDLIPGLEEAIKTMRVGESALFFIPPNLAFGNRGRLGVPPNSKVVYSVVLESVN